MRFMQKETEKMEEIHPEIRIPQKHIHAEDLAQKAAVQYFGEEVASWLGIEQKVQAVAPTEKVKIGMRHLYEDFNFIMENGEWYHFEFESDKVTRKDMKRYREYEATTSAVYGVDVVTCVVSSCKKKKALAVLKTGINKYHVRMIWLKEYDISEIFRTLRTKMTASVQKKDLIPVSLCPLLGGKVSMTERVKEGFDLLQKPYVEVEREDLGRLQAILFILAQKFLKEEEMGKVKEGMHMTYLGQLIYNDGLIKGREEGIEKGMAKGIHILINTCREFGLSRTAVCEKLVRDFSLMPQKAEEYMEQFWEKKA